MPGIQDWLAEDLLGCLSQLLHSWAYNPPQLLPWVFWRSNSEIHACRVNTFLAELSLQNCPYLDKGQVQVQLVRANNRMVRNTSLRRPRRLAEAAGVSRGHISELPVFSLSSPTSQSPTSSYMQGNGADTWQGLPQPSYLRVEDLTLRPSFLNSLLSVATEGP